ncbi:hypothetical protein ABIF90_008131 [Bradyrhizobium japonicum]
MIRFQYRQLMTQIGNRANPIVKAAIQPLPWLGVRTAPTAGCTTDDAMAYVSLLRMI